MLPLFQYLEKFHPLSGEFKASYEKNCKVIHVKKYKHVLSPIDHNTSLYFLVSGLVRGFVKDGKKDRNKYYLQKCCWDSGRMNKKALAARIPTHKCLDCGKLMDRGSYGTGPLGKIHYGCGGSVVGLKAIAAAKVKSHPSA
jgi:hypothetical protein